LSDDVNKPVELDGLGGVGWIWGIASEDLNATVLSWNPGQGIEEITAGVTGLRYVSVHQCRGPLQIASAGGTG
jgi:hypothetical protein